MTAKPMPQQTLSEDVSNLRDRVNQSLLRLGFSKARFVDAEEETITLICPVSDRNAQCVMSVAIRLLPSASGTI